MMEILTNHRKTATTRKAPLSHQGLYVTNPSDIRTEMVFAASKAEAFPGHKRAIGARLQGQGTRGSKAVMDSAAGCPVQEPDGEQANLQYLHMQGCHWVALLKAAESIILSTRHKCRYIADNRIQLLMFSSSPRPQRRQKLRQRREWQSNEMKQGNALLGRNKIIKRERTNLFLHFQFLRKTAELTLCPRRCSL